MKADADHRVGRGNPIVFHPQVAFDEILGVRMIALIDELDPLHRMPARTIALDVFDLSVPPSSGSDRHAFETVTRTYPDEVKSDPLVTSRFVHVIGSQDGVETWGGCDDVIGRIDTDDFPQLTCGDIEIHGTVTSGVTISVVDLILDDRYLGTATLGASSRRADLPGAVVRNWSLRTNFGIVQPGNHRLTAIATDVHNKEHRFASQTVFLAGTKCSQRRRAGSK